MGFYLPQSVSEKKKKRHETLFIQSGISAHKNDTIIFISKVLTWWKI